METQTTISTSECFRFWLQNRLMEKCRANPKYSLRAFAQYLDMDASSVSQIISGKRKASDKVITKICEKLSVSPSETKKFIQNAKISSREKTNTDYEIMAEDAFAYISNWYHYAILELTFTGNLANDPQYISKTLSITVTEAKMAIERLLRLGLLIEEKEILKKTNRFITNILSPGFSSSPQRELQRQILKMALHSIDHCSPEERDMTSMTMAIDMDKLPEARKLITQFRRDLCNFLEDGEQTRVYQLGIQLYPVSHTEEK